MSLPLDVAVTALSFDTISVDRSGGAYENGIWVPDPDEDLDEVGASVTPVTGYDLLQLPEGRRSEATIRIILTTELILGDAVTWQGRRYIVNSVGDWSVIGGFYDCLAAQETP